LFLHGQNDVAVPIATAQAYEAQLKKQSIEAAMIVDPKVGHQWIDASPAAVTCWFKGH
jgi:dipeptidyl aminopeptidase/acylaminoacyl peptidase